MFHYFAQQHNAMIYIVALILSIDRMGSISDHQFKHNRNQYTDSEINQLFNETLELTDDTQFEGEGQIVVLGIWTPDSGEYFAFTKYTDDEAVPFSKGSGICSLSLFDSFLSLFV